MKMYCVHHVHAKSFRFNLNLKAAMFSEDTPQLGPQAECHCIVQQHMAQARYQGDCANTSPTNRTEHTSRRITGLCMFTARKQPVRRPRANYSGQGSWEIRPVKLYFPILHQSMQSKANNCVYVCIHIYVGHIYAYMCVCVFVKLPTIAHHFIGGRRTRGPPS
jgi:hypothetical protein